MMNQSFEYNTKSTFIEAVLCVLMIFAIICTTVVLSSDQNNKMKHNISLKHEQNTAQKDKTSAVIDRRMKTMKPSQRTSIDVNNISKAMESDEKIVDALEDASVNDNVAMLRRILGEMQKKAGWERVFSKDVQIAAVEAAGDHAAKMSAELAGFLASPHEEVVENALDAFSMMFEELDDEEQIADLIVTLSRIAENDDFIEDALAEMDTLDPQPKLKAMSGVLKDGNEKFKSKLRAELEEMTDGKVKADQKDDIALLEKLKQWTSDEIADNDD